MALILNTNSHELGTHNLLFNNLYEFEIFLLMVLQILQTILQSTQRVEDMKGDLNQVEQNLDIIESIPFLMEDEFNL